MASLNTIFVAIMSSKGGVGKTTTAINLACALEEFGRNVVLVDGNYSKPNIGLQLGITNVTKTIHHSLQAEEDITDAVYEHPSGVKVVPGSIIHEEVQGQHHRKFADVILSLKGKCEMVIIDSGPGHSKEMDDVLDAADQAIIVTTPDLTSITDGLRTKRYCEAKGVDIMGIVVTHLKQASHETSVSDIQTIFDEKIIGEIPYDENIKFSQKAKYPVVYANLRAPATFAYKKLAGNIIGEPYEEDLTSKDSLFDYVLRKVGLR